MDDCQGCKGSGIITCPRFFPWTIFICPMCDGEGETFGLKLYKPIEHINVTTVLVVSEENQP